MIMEAMAGWLVRPNGKKARPIQVLVKTAGGG